MKKPLKREKRRENTNKAVKHKATVLTFAGTILMMLIVMVALFRFVVFQVSFKETLSVLVVAFLIYIFFRASSWFVSGFTVTVMAPVEQESKEMNEIAPAKVHDGSADGVNSYMDKRFGDG